MYVLTCGGPLLTLLTALAATPVGPTDRCSGGPEPEDCPTVKGRHPYVALIYLEMHPVMTGALVSLSWAVSVSHLIVDNKTNVTGNNYVLAGLVTQNDTNSPDSQQQNVKRLYVQDDKRHAQYKCVLLIHVEAPFKETPFVTSVAVISADSFLPAWHMPCTLLEWRYDRQLTGHVLYESTLTLRPLHTRRMNGRESYILTDGKAITSCTYVTTGVVTCLGSLTALKMQYDTYEAIAGYKESDDCKQFYFYRRLYVLLGRFQNWMRFLMCNCEDVPAFQRLTDADATADAGTCACPLPLLLVTLCLILCLVINC